MVEEARRGLDFRGRARVEADRYGPDPWVFVRELLQNARDAGATAVEILVAEEAGQLRVEVRDDGEGMSYEHARRYLFALYASSKESRVDQAGRFGVGFGRSCASSRRRSRCARGRARAARRSCASAATSAPRCDGRRRWSRAHT